MTETARLLVDQLETARQALDETLQRLVDAQAEIRLLRASRVTLIETAKRAGRRPCVQPTCGFDGAHFHKIEDEYLDVLDAWRGLTEEQRQWFYREQHMTYERIEAMPLAGNAIETSSIAVRLLKAAAR